jgi:hypothetical protein
MCLVVPTDDETLGVRNAATGSLRRPSAPAEFFIFPQPKLRAILVQP